MYFVFLWEVLKRAFTPAPRVTDMLQILAASTLPAVTKFIGVRMPESASNDALAYIGLVALSFIVIRLFWAPYAMWKEQGEESVGLRLELSKPERLVIAEMAKHRAKARAKIAAELEKFHLISYRNGPREGDEDPDRHFDRAAKIMHKIRLLQSQAGLSDSFDAARMAFLNYVLKEADLKDEKLPMQRNSTDLLKLMQLYLVGGLTAEGLALRLPPCTGSETQP